MHKMHRTDEEKRRRNIRLAVFLGGFVIFNMVISLTLWIHKFNQASALLK